MKKVLITQMIPKEGIDLLKEHFEVILPVDEEKFDRESIERESKKVDAILTQLSDTIDETFIKSHTNIKIYSNYAVGYNNYDTNYGKKNGVIMTNTPDVLSDTTAELAISLLFATSRRLFEARSVIDNSEWKGFRPTFLLGQDISNKKIGVIGAGRIGQSFMQKLIGFNPEFYYFNRKRNLDIEEKFGAKYLSFDELIEQADIISIHVPLTEDTKYLFNEESFKKMKKNAILINTSRGPVIDEMAMIQALKNKEFWGAGLDVFENEPYISKELLELKNVVLTPHIGSATLETRRKMSILAAKNIIEVLYERKPITPIY
jgi:glyoxylate reductase